MSDYSTLHQIIELQYAKKQDKDSDIKGWHWGWFFNQSFMLGKGYITPSNYLNNINNVINKNENDKNQGNPIYLHTQ